MKIDTTFNHLLNAPIQVKENVFYILKHTLLYIKESKLSNSKYLIIKYLPQC